MPSNMVDAVRNIPIIIEKNMPHPMVVDNDETGFPFDKDIDRDSSFRNQLDDIAKRHPELAGHFDGFPFRTNSLGRRNHQQQQQQQPPDETDDGFSRFTSRDRPFGGSRFEQFGFPFTRDGSPFATTPEPSPKYHQQPPQHSPQQTPQPSPNSAQQTYTADPHNATGTEDNAQSAEKPPQAPERSRRPQNIQPSNTADLTQKQEAVNDRSQRSMSAPPPENRSQPRYVSSINIPIQRDHPAAGDSHSSPQGTPQQQQQGFKPTERVIPIHVEGRDEPVMPKTVHQTYAQPSPHPTGFAPEPEPIFGGRNMGDFMGRNTGRFPTREDVFGRQYQMPPEPQRFQQPKQQTPPKTYPVPPQQQPQQQQQQVPPQQQQQNVHHPQPEMQPQNQEQQHPQPQQQNQKPSPIDLIKAIQKDVSALMAQVDQFAGAPKDKQYLYLDEMLTRNLIKLDNIDTQGQENIRLARREAIKCIERCIGILESKANANVAAKGETMEVDQKTETQPENEAKSDGTNEAKSEGQEQQQTMEAEVSSTSNEGQQVAEQAKSVEAMEVVPVPNQGQEQKGNVEGANESSEASAKCDAAPTVQSSDGSKPEDGVNKANVESSEAVAVAADETKMEVESAKSATEGSGDNTVAEGKDQAQPDSSSQVKEGSKDENKKEKKKGKKKEKTEKK